MASSNPTSPSASPSPEPLEDRFKTYWTGPYHPKAIAWAAANDIGYDFNGNDRYIQIRPSAYSHRQVGGGGTDLGRIRDANDDYDDLVRERHADDQELGDDTRLVGGVAWHKATRGMKLRTLKLWKLMNEDLMRTWNERIVALDREIESVSEEGKKIEMDGELVGLRADMVKLEEVLRLIDQANQLVLAETEDGWNWKTGIKAQEEVVVEQNKMTMQVALKHKELGPPMEKRKLEELIREVCGLDEGEDIILPRGPDLDD